MRADEARALVGVLIAAFPDVVVERPTEELYTAQLSRLDSATAAREAAELIVRSSRRFPTIAEFRAAYLPVRRREAEEAARSRGLDEGPPVPMPDYARDAVARLVGGGEPDANPVEGLEERPAGRCDDCGEDSGKTPRWLYGKVTLCRACVIPRARLSGKVPEGERS